MIDNPSSGQGMHRAGKYSNFQDPVGLLLRMLRSGNRIAYGALSRAALSIGVGPLDWMMQSKERRCLAAVGEAEAKHPLALIVGAPRSGSTLFYQTMARYSDVSYLTNLTAMFPRSPITATQWLHGKTKQAEADFRSYYGQSAGLGSPNDGFEVWNRWLGNDRYETPDSIDSNTAHEMRQFFSAWSQTFDKPLLNKNNRNTFCLQLLACALPQAHFVVIRRSPLFVAQSLIEARLQVQGSKDRPWGLASYADRAASNDPLSYIDSVCDQLGEIETRLKQQLESVAPERYVEVTYEDFCRDPQSVLHQVAGTIPGLRLHEEQMSAELTPFSISSTLRLSQEEKQRLERRLADTLSLQVQHERSLSSEAP